ncbi:phage terminase large subunit family protein, partial [Lachnotalea glycerini]
MKKIDSNQQAIKNLNNTVKRSVENFKPPELITVQQWSDKYRRLSPENSAEPGRWRTERTPYLVEPMSAFTDSKIHRIVVVASSQVGKTEMLMNMLGYAIDIDPGPIMWVTPTQDNAEDFSKRRIAPMIRDTKPLKAKIEPSKSRSRDNTVLKKKYPGGMLTMT